VQVLDLGFADAPGIWRHRRGQEDFWSVHHCSARQSQCWAFLHPSPFLPLIVSSTVLGSIVCVTAKGTRPATRRVTNVVGCILTGCCCLLVVCFCRVKTLGGVDKGGSRCREARK